MIIYQNIKLPNLVLIVIVREKLLKTGIILKMLCHFCSRFYSKGNDHNYGY